MRTTSLLKEALRYADLGWRVLPLHNPTGAGCSCGDENCSSPGKHPRTRNGVNDASTDHKTIESWWQRWPDANIGIATGKHSGLVVLDVDTESAGEIIKKKGISPTVQSHTGKGVHHYFKHPGTHIANKINATFGFDIKADGGYVLAPPSLHPSGKTYSWADWLDPWEAEIEKMPEWLLDYISSNGRSAPCKTSGWQNEVLKGVSSGSRNQTAASLAGRYISKGLTDEEVIEILLGWNKKNDPPLQDSEIIRTVQSVSATHLRNEKKQDRQLEKVPKSSQFPDIMKGLAGDFARLYSSHLESPVHFFFIAFLVCLGSVLAGKLTLASEIAPQPRLYAVLLGESADDRKSTAISKTTDFFWEALTGGFQACYGVGSAEGLQKRLEESKSLLLCFDEFKQFVSKCRIDASVLLPCVNTLFESNRYESRTKKTDIKLEDAYLSILAASTVQTYENTWTSQFTDIGFNNRLFVVPGSGERKHSLPTSIPDSDKYLLKQRLAEILRHVGDGLQLDISSEARELYDNWYMNLEGSIHSKRLDVYALRLMSLLAVNELKGEVDAETVRSVIAMCDWQLEMRRLHDPVDADNEMAKVEERIRRVLKASGPLKEWELKRAINASRKGLWFYNTAKNNLKKEGELIYHMKEKKYFLKHV